MRRQALPRPISLVLVSHSAKLSHGLAALVRETATSEIRVLPVGGARGGGLGIDHQSVVDAVRASAAAGEVVVLVDLGSSVIAARAALKELSAEDRQRVRLVDAPLVEGATAAAATAATGAPLRAVVRAAEEARRVAKF